MKTNAFLHFNITSYRIFFSVVILCAAPSKVRKILLAAHDLGMMKNGEYVFFNVDLFTK